jgi:hypothetical protein
MLLHCADWKTKLVKKKKHSNKEINSKFNALNIILKVFLQTLLDLTVNILHDHLNIFSHKELK